MDNEQAANALRPFFDKFARLYHELNTGSTIMRNFSQHQGIDLDGALQEMRQVDRLIWDRMQKLLDPDPPVE